MTKYPFQVHVWFRTNKEQTFNYDDVAAAVGKALALVRRSDIRLVQIRMVVAEWPGLPEINRPQR